MFERPHHRRIGLLLERLEADVFLKNRCLFGGGTAIALAHGEYRESIDGHFICDSVDGYRELRSLVHRDGFSWAFTEPVKLVREPQVDQYGIRTAVEVEGVPIKFEIVHEGRVDFDAPVETDRIRGVWRMTAVDLTATKLMANTDRWAASVVMSRDLIDMAMMAPKGRLPRAGVDKAERAYGAAVADAFQTAKAALLDKPGRLKECMKAMGMTLPEGTLRSAIDRLAFEKPASARRTIAP